MIFDLSVSVLSWLLRLAAEIAFEDPFEAHEDMILVNVAIRVLKEVYIYTYCRLQFWILGALIFASRRAKPLAFNAETLKTHCVL